MNTKKSYQVGDTVWIHGITRDNKLTEGVVVKKFQIDYNNWSDEEHYVIAITTEIEPLLEIRTWHSISQDNIGPIGLFRDNPSRLKSTSKFLKKIGIEFNPTQDNHDEEDDEISPDVIHAALEESQKVANHTPLNLKDPKKNYRKFSKRKKLC